MFKGKKIVQGNEQAIHAKKEAEKKPRTISTMTKPSAGDYCRKHALKYFVSVNWHTFLETVSGWQ